MALLSPYRGTYVNARLASEEIDAQSIINGCNAVDNCAGQICVLSDNISTVGSDITVDALLIDDKSIDGSLKDCCNGIGSIHDGITNTTMQIKEIAEAIYNSIQEQYNDEARLKDKAIYEENKKRGNV